MNITDELNRTKAELLNGISAIDEKKFNQVPFVGSWTAAQVTEHLLKATAADVLYAETLETDRETGEKLQAISDVFLDFSVRYTSPDFILPSHIPQDKNIALAKLEQVFDKLIQASYTLNLNPICTTFEVPGFGPFTRLEFLWFFNVHTQRHIRQLNNIAVALAAA